MPVFESGEQIDSKEFKRQQQALNDKVFRLTYLELLEESEDLEEFAGGDCWEKYENSTSE